MYINRLNNRIKIYQDPYNADGLGGYCDDKKVPVTECWAEVIRPNYRNQLNNGVDLAITDLVLNLRKNKAVKRGMYVVLDDDEYQIIQVDNYNKEITQLIVRTMEVGL